MDIISGHRHPVRRALTRLALIAGLTTGGFALVPSAPGATQVEAPAPADLAVFDARAVGSIVNFSFHVPEAFFPFQITGGLLESTSRATSSPLAFGTAGLAPVPLATSVGLVIPRFVPGTEIPVPEDVQDAFKSIDFTALPNGCQASFPPVKEGDGEAVCGGPYQRDAALGFTAAGLGGHVRASGTLEQPFATRTVSISRGGDVTVPGLQATFHQAYSEGVTGLNEAGLPQGHAVAEIDSVSILGALIRLEGIRSETVVATDGTFDAAQARSTFTVRAASVFGIPVTIGPDGVSVNRKAVPATELRTAAARVESTLAGAGGMKIRLVPAPPVEVRGGEVTAQSGAIEISYRSQEPTPVDVVQRIGYSRARVNAVPGVAEAEAPGGETVPSIGLAPAEGGGPAGTGAGGVAAEGGGPAGVNAGGVAAEARFSGPSGPAGVTVPARDRAPRLASPVPVESPSPAAPDAGAGPGGASGGARAESSAAPAAAHQGGLDDQSVLAVRTTGFSPAARTRLKAIYGGLAAFSVLGFVLVPLLRTLVRAPVRRPAER